MLCEKTKCVGTRDVKKCVYILGLGGKIGVFNNRLLSVPQQNPDSFQFPDLGEECFLTLKRKIFFKGHVQVIQSKTKSYS